MFLETDANFGTIGTLVPQPTPSSATLEGAYGLLQSDQNNPANSDGGFVGNFVVTPGAGTFTGQGAFQGQGTSNATLIVGPVAGTFVADTANPGRFTGSITTTPAFPNGALGGTYAWNAASFLLHGQRIEGFIVQTDTGAPVTGLVEAQDPPSSSAKAAKGFRVPQSRQSYPTERGDAQHGHPSKPR